IRHSLAVERISLRLARRIRANGHKLDLRLVSLGALLHDIGRARTHGIRHGVEGAKILRGLGLGKFARFAERHLGAGIPAGEARELGLPARDFMPRTLEEKVIAYADKLVMGHRMASYEQALDWFRSELGPKHPALNRFKALHREIQKMAGPD
ncbi:MAG: TIGR00295 family protein, partial [Candidatus Hadarchaeaceae archaeon]